MESFAYGFKVTTSLGVLQAVDRVREALVAEGFGVLTEIDLSGTLHAKLGVDVPPYWILGACRPSLAAQAVQQEPDVGLLLPCNLAVYARGDQSVVAALDPWTMVDLTRNQALDEIAADARGRLQRVLEAVAD